MEGVLAQSIRPFRRWYDYRTRSTRTELIGFSVLSGLIGGGVAFAAMLAGGDVDFQARLTVVLNLILLIPSLPLAVRRLHDSGRSGAFLVLALPVWISNAHTELTRLRYGWSSVPDRPWWLDTMFFMAAATLFVLLLWNDDPLPNEYGPNPRYDDLPEPQPTQPAPRS